MQTKFTLLFLLATWVSNAQYQIFFKDQFLVSTNEIKQDSLGVHYKQSGVEKIAAYKDLYAIKGEEESFFFRGRYARRTRQYQPNFFDLSKDFSVGVNVMNLFRDQLEILASYYLDSQREFELQLNARIAFAEQPRNTTNRMFKNNLSLDLVKYVTLKRRVRFGYGIGAGVGSRKYDFANLDKDNHPDYILSEIRRVENTGGSKGYLAGLKDAYPKAVKGANENFTYSVNAFMKLRAMLTSKISLNFKVALGTEWGNYYEKVKGGYNGMADIEKYNEVYFNPTIGINYHFNIN